MGLASAPVLATFHAAVERYRLPILALALAATVALGREMVRLSFDNSLGIWFLENDPDIVAYRQFLDLFGTDESIVVLLEPGDAFAPDFLRRLRRFSRSAARLPDVVNVLSLTSADAVRGSGDSVDIGPLVPTLPRSPGAASALRRRVTGDRLYRGWLVTPDGRATAAIIEVRHAEGDFSYKTRLIASVKELVREVFGGIPAHVSGGPVVDDAFFRYSQRDTSVFVPAMLAVLVVTLAWLLRSLWGVVLPVALVCMATAWTYGIMPLVGWPLTVVETALVPLIMAVGVADSVHILAELRRLRGEGLEPGSARREAFTSLFAPCLTTSLTTAAGMLSLSVAPLAPVRHFGMLAAFGTAVAFLLTFTALPAALTLLPQHALSARRGGSEERVLGMLGRVGWKRARLVTAAAAAVIAASFLGITRIHVGTSMLAYFRPSDPVMADMRAVDEAVGGTGDVEVLVRGRGRRDFTDPALIAGLYELGAFMERLPGIGNAFSVAEPLVELNRAFQGQDATPSSARLAAQYMLLLEGSDLFDRYLSPDRRVARLRAGVLLSQWDLALGDLEKIEAQARELFAGSAEVRITGYLKLMANMESYLVASQIRSFLLAFSVVLVMIAVLLRSLRLGLFSMIPNLPPVLLALGIMGWTGISLDSGTVMIAGIVLGLVVDDTIHFMSHLQRRLRHGDPLDAAVEETERVVGPPITATSLVLAASFSTGMLGSFRPNVNFGMLSAIAVLAALAFDLVVLPAMIALVRPRL